VRVSSNAPCCIVALLVAPSVWAADPPPDSATQPSGPPAAPSSGQEEASVSADAPAVSDDPEGGEKEEPAADPDAVSEPTPQTGAREAATPTAPSNTVADSPYGNTSTPQEPSPPSEPPPTEDADDVPATLFDSHSDYAIGGFGGFGPAYTRFAGRNAALMCGEGAVLIDHALSLGGGGCGLVTEFDAEQYGPEPHDPNDRLQFGYGGAIVRYHFFSRKMINVSVGALIGGGGLVIGTWDGSGNDWESDYSHKRGDGVFVFEPQVGGHANLTRWLRLGASAGYRFVAGIDTQGLSSWEVGGPTLTGHIHLGWF